MHLLHQFVRLGRGDPPGGDGGQHPDRDPVAPVEQRVLFDERLRAVEHHGKNLHARLLGQREGPRLETVNLAVLGARPLREYGHRSAARNP